MTDQLNRLRQRFGQLLVLVFWCHVPLLGIVALLTGTMPVSGAMLIGAVMAAIYQVTWYRAGTAPVTRHVAAVLLIGQPSLLLVLLQGHMWQMDMHMYFFAMIALNIAWFDRTALVVAATITALHHLVLLYFLPLAVFSTEGDLVRVALHAVIVLFQTVVLIWVSDKVVESFRRIDRMGTRLVAQSETLKLRSHEAEQASRAKGMFLATMSHEIRTPINAIIGFCHLIQRTPLDARQRDQIGKISSAGTTLLRLVNDILDLSKGEAGHLTLEDEVFDPRAELSRQIQLLSEPLYRKNLDIRVQIDPNIPPLLSGDITRLNQVLTNLLGNAIKFTSEGTITIEARLVERKGDIAVIESAISDNGIGMTAEQLSRMFTPFMQADSSTTRRFGGTGLGLAICRQIVEQMGGWIRAESEPGHGSTFTVMTPLRIPEPQVLPDALPSEAIRRLHVLLVDDNLITCRIIQEIFRRWGMTIDIADGGSVALAVARREFQAGRRHDLVIMDWKMPGMDGLQTLHAMRAVLGAEFAPFVMMTTSYDIDEVRQDANGKGVDLLLAKPIDAANLLHALNQLPLVRADQPVQEAPARGPSLPPALRGLRVLLVEDNEINREIAAQILSDAGLVVDCAADGSIACRMVEQAGAAYSAVLMDIQMPEMDGMTATRHIRKTWSSAQLPIIAMTAHAFAEERQDCLAAGMDDHLTKSVDPAHLIATLERWLVMGRNAVSGTASLPDALPPFGIAAALARVNGNRDLLLRLILSFADSHAHACDDLTTLLDQGKAEDAHRLAHTLRGVAASLELPDVAAAAGQLEQALSPGGEGDVAALLALLRPPLARAVAAAGQLRSMASVALPMRGASPQADADPNLLAEALDTLRDQIRRRSLSARHGFVQLADLLRLDDAARQAHPLHVALQRLDYGAASALIDAEFAVPVKGIAV
ncbi:response regulator [Paracoccus sp. WLY502]|uniref:response regulator n=1 Tax=Paracoccus yibinensis TaxID=3068891 RepID=UPI0027969826|nr:response regulator [Paracoccus sp. WLY502]MDQ1900567.1 response regulator [Paracoccus sp. WLY502]